MAYSYDAVYQDHTGQECKDIIGTKRPLSFATAERIYRARGLKLICLSWRA